MKVIKNILHITNSRKLTKKSFQSSHLFGKYLQLNKIYNIF
jgi:hypothetical protein